jgi:hypothetical protein
MNAKVLLATLAGGAASFLLGWVLYGMLLKGFFESQVLASAKPVMRTEPVIWAIFVGCLSWAALQALIFSFWAGISTFMTGAKAGAWIGFLVSLGANFFSYGSLDAWNITAALVDPVVNVALGGISGGVVGWVLGYGNKV